MRSFLRVLKFAIQGFFRNFWLSIVTVTMMLMALFSTTMLLSIDYLKKATIEGVEKKVDVLVSLKPKLEQAKVEWLVAELKADPDVQKVTIITPEENRALYEQSNLSDKAKKVLEVFGDNENPFSYSLAIQAHDLSQYQNILTFVSNDKYKELVDSSDFNDYDAFVNKIDSFAKVINKYSWYVILAFLLISIIVIFNTIRISIYSRQSEVTVMKLVGASNSFIRWPFLLEGVLYALVSVLLLLAIVYPLLNLIQPSLTSYFQDASVINIQQYFRVNFWLIFGGQFLALALINMISTSIAVRRYLKV